MWPPSIGEATTVLLIVLTFIAGFVRIKIEVSRIGGEVFHEKRGNQALYSQQDKHIMLTEAHWTHVSDELKELKQAMKEGLSEIRNALMSTGTKAG